MKFYLLTFTFFLVVAFSSVLSRSAYAASGGGQETWSIGDFGGIITANEADMNLLISRSASRGSGTNTPQFGNAYEFGGYLQRRINGSIVALQLRPTYFTDSVSGTGSNGNYNYSISGYTITPILRVYMLENNNIKLYAQGGVGWGTLSGQITEGPASVNFNGSNFGFQAGLGVSFCFGTRNQHCAFTEGNVRYLSIDRNLVTSTAGTFSNSTTFPSLSQTNKGQEIEIDGHDMAVSMSGIQGIIGYQFNL
jgi:hypothetical protein